MSQPSTPATHPLPRPRREWLALVIPVVVAIAVIAVAGTALVVTGEDDAATVSDPAAPDLSQVEVYEDLTTRHVEDEVDYDQSPPVGGDHDPAWHECGVYDEPVREENMVHSLEHGTVWVTYVPGLTDDEVEAIVEKLPDDSIVSPYPDQEAPVVVTVWERQLRLEGPDDPRLELFVAEYGDGHTSPEPLVTCAGGVVATEDGSSGRDA